VSERKTPDVTNVFVQLTAALSLLARAKGEEPQKQYFFHSTASVATLQLDGGVYQVVLTQDEPTEEKKEIG
jgi:hypothetical protein